MRKIVLLLILVWGVGYVAAQEYTDIKVMQLPKKTQAYLAENMKGMTPSRTVKIENNGVLSYGVVYEVSGRKRVLVFDKDGNFTQKGDKLNSGSAAVQPANSSGTGTIKPAGNNTIPIAVEKLPAPTQTYLKTTYPSGKIAISNQLTENSIIFYQVTVIDGNKSHVIAFDSKGKYLSEQTFTKQK
jgi:hypothetical protein